MKLLILSLFILTTTAFAQLPKIEPGVSQELAKWRSVQYSNISYKLNLTLEKMSPVLKGSMEIHVTQAASACAEPNCPPLYLILDWRKLPGHEKDSTVSNIHLNGSPIVLARWGGDTVTFADPSIPTEKHVVETNDHLMFHDGVRMGENVITLDFTSPILTSGSAITRYIDKEDGSEYIYSLFVPSDASTAFPVFDQPDLKARFSLKVRRPEAWNVVSNIDGQQLSIADCVQIPPDRTINCPQETTFEETKPISTYVFAFAAGPWERVSSPHVSKGQLSDRPVSGTGPSATWPSLTVGLRTRSADPVESTVPGDVFVRKSQLAKYKPHAEEVARLRDAAIQYLETYFDYKFPWPKYDLVLIPEFPFGGMEHAGATFLRESSVIFPTEPTKGDQISRANVIFHETAHQWFGDLVTMRWFDDLWLKEGFAEFMAYKTLEHVMPDANAWKVFYERNKHAAYLTDSTRGTTPIYQPIANLSAAKSAYGNIVYRKAPSFLRQAEFYLGEDKFQTAVRTFLKKHEYGNAGWENLVDEFGDASWQQFGGIGNISTQSFRNADGTMTTTTSYDERPGISAKERWKAEQKGRKEIRDWASNWVNTRGLSIVRYYVGPVTWPGSSVSSVLTPGPGLTLSQTNALGEKTLSDIKFNVLFAYGPGSENTLTFSLGRDERQSKLGIHTTEVNSLESGSGVSSRRDPLTTSPIFVFPNYGDYGYGIFLLDDKSREYVLKHIGEEKDPFLRSMMWGALWDSVREAEMDPREYVELVIRQLPTEGDETIASSLLGRVGTALNYYMPAEPDCVSSQHVSRGNMEDGSVPLMSRTPNGPLLTCGLRTQLEAVLLDRMQHASTLGQRITFYRAYVNNASTAAARGVLKDILSGKLPIEGVNCRGGACDQPIRPNPSASPTPARAADQPYVGGGPRFPLYVLKTKDKFDIVTRLAVMDDPDAPKLLTELEKTETSDDAKRYAYAAHAAFPTTENKAKFWNDFVNNKDVSESWIEAAIGPFNSIRHPELSQPYLTRALAELPNLKRTRKIFFVNNWLSAWLGGQRDQAAMDIVNKFLADNPNLDNDLRLKVLENVDVIERAVKIRKKFGHG
jgi:aminopeptidase N